MTSEEQLISTDGDAAYGLLSPALIMRGFFMSNTLTTTDLLRTDGSGKSGVSVVAFTFYGQKRKFVTPLDIASEKWSRYTRAH